MSDAANAGPAPPRMGAAFEDLPPVPDDAFSLPEAAEDADGSLAQRGSGPEVGSPLPRARRLLIVDDDVTTIRMLHAIVSQDAPDICFATSGKEGLQLAAERRPDVILLDAELGDVDGYSVCRQLKSNPITADIPVIFVTGHEDMQHELRALDAGAADFITKPPSPARLRARIATQLRMKRLTDQLRLAAAVDGLTGVSSRRAFDVRLTEECRRGVRGRHPLSLMMIDVDHFKRYNDQYGHVAGDRVLRAIAGTLQKSVRSPPDMVARYGGEEFVILLPETTAAEAVSLAQRICHAVTDLDIEHGACGDPGRVSISVGVASLEPLDEWALQDVAKVTTDLISRADAAMYRAKREGRNRVRCDPASAGDAAGRRPD
jgi:diguanylate cyclase (GGDEF)-like protein